jgi:predicted RNA-binding Zn-ribbon protein involved in translation (DUF1610 family)
MAYRMPGSCTSCGTEYTQISGIDVDKEKRSALNWHYSCPKCGNVGFHPALPALDWTMTDKSLRPRKKVLP